MLPRVPFLITILVLSILTFGWQAPAQKAAEYETLSTAQGLSQGMAFNLLQDRVGFIWVATKHGLNRIEGYGFNVFSHDAYTEKSLSRNTLVKLVEDSMGLIWAGTDDAGLNVVALKKDVFEKDAKLLCIEVALNNNIRMYDMGKDTNGTLWVSGLEGSVYIFCLITNSIILVENTQLLNNGYHPPGGSSNYTFIAQGSNSQDIWSEKTNELQITVLPPWWGTWWAYLVYALFVGLLIRTWCVLSTNRAKLQSQLDLEKLETKRVKELDTLKTQLYTNITHEFRTPLTVILGMAQQVSDKPTEHFTKGMDIIIRNGQSLLNLVNEMQDLSKLEAGKMQLHLSKADIIHFLRYIVESFHSLAESQQKQVHFLSEIDSLYLQFDQEKMGKIVSNLLSNALKFTAEKGNIYIAVSENSPTQNGQETTFIIKVKDTGIGIPENQMPHIFDRFYQINNAYTKKTEGTGIGLALTKELVKLMEGEISVKSPPTGATKGTEFTILLPLLKVAAVENDLPAEVKERTHAPKAAQPLFAVNAIECQPSFLEKPLLLLVEDNADVVAYTASCLPDYRLAVAQNGREGFEIASQIIPNLVITDVMMPFVDGFEMCRQLRGDERTSHVPIIMLTAKADMESKIEGFQQGADAYLEKPFNREELLVRIKKLLEMRQSLQLYYLKKAGLETKVLPVELMLDGVIKDTEIEDEFVKKIRKVIEDNITVTSFSVEQLCKFVGMSHSQLHRKLEALTGCPPNKFIRIIRLNKAKALLETTSDSIAAIALECGFSDPAYFARVFKHEHQVTPHEWRSNN
jgi:signal transduction histidine kinase/DNA-binding response OmpR family regulator